MTAFETINRSDSNGFTVNLEFLAGIIRGFAFVGFFTFTAGVLYYSRENERLKTIFSTAVIIGIILIFVAGQFGVTLPPFVAWSYFSEPAPETDNQFHIFVVDENGKELRYSPLAAPPSATWQYAGHFNKEFSPHERNQTAAFLLDRARKHRMVIEDGTTFTEWFRYRSFGGLPNREYGRWSSKELANYSEFTGIRVYAVNVTASDGRSINQVEKTKIYEYQSNATVS
jgi:hypothetical protein